MDRRRLLSFIALAEELHFERAAARSHITQSAMSQQLLHLERQLGVKLLYRTKRHVSLTRAGAVFLDEARRIVGQMDAAMRLTREIDGGQRGQLVVGVTAPALYIVFPEIVASLNQALPNVQIMAREMTTAEQEEAPPGRGHPGRHRPSAAGRRGAGLPGDRAHPVRPRSLGAQPAVAEAGAEPCRSRRPTLHPVPRRIGPRLYDRILSMCAEAGFSPEVILEAFPAQSIVALAACNFGIGFIASSVQHFERPLAVYRKLSPRAPILTLGVAYRQDEFSPLSSPSSRLPSGVARGVKIG